MAVKHKTVKSTRLKFDTRQSVKRARTARENTRIWSIKTTTNTIQWESRMDRIKLIREGLPYESVEIISVQAGLPVKKILKYIDIPQTTYNKNKKENNLLSSSKSETILLLSELINYGLDVFNGEKEKFNRWLFKPNISLGDVSPENLFDSISGIHEVKSALNRIEYGNMA